MSAFVPPSGGSGLPADTSSAPAAGSASTDANNDVSSTDIGTNALGDSMTMGQLQPSYSPPSVQAPVDQHNYTPSGTPGVYAHHAPGEAAPAHRPNISTRHAVSHVGLGKAIAHLRGMGKSSGAPKTEKGPHSSEGMRSAGLKSNGGLKAGSGLKSK